MRQKRQMAAGLLALLTALSLTACGTEPSGASPTGGEEGGSATEPCAAYLRAGLDAQYKSHRRICRH